jgi:hypothetical protein
VISEAVTTMTDIYARGAEGTASDEAAAPADLCRSAPTLREAGVY